MRGVVLLGDRQVEIREFPCPTPRPDQVLVRMKVATICGSDMHFYRSKPKELGERARWIAGHEISGVVEHLGEAVQGLQVGDRVSVFHLYGCGCCEMCRKGYPQYCNTPGGFTTLVAGQGSHPWRSSGAMADYVLAPGWVCLKLPDDLSFTDGAILGCTGVTAYQILKKLDVTARDTVAIYGLGPVGECATLIAKALGARVIGVDVVEERIRLAENLGLDEAINAAKMDPVDRILASTRRKGGADVVVDFSGNPDAIKNALRSVKNLGKVGLVGVGPRIGEASISPSAFMNRGVWITGIRVSNINLWFDVVHLMLDHGLSFESIVTHKFSLKQAEEAFRLFDTLTTGKIAFTDLIRAHA